MKFGFDIHGVSDTYPEIFAKMSEALVNAGHEVHILTGPPWNDRIKNELKDIGMVYTHFFSILDSLESKGVPITWDEKGHGHADKTFWNRAKAEYCVEVGIDLHIDDSDEYHEHFTTPYLLMIKRKE